MTTIAIAILALAIGIYVGSIVFGNEAPKLQTDAQNPIKVYHPVVISMVFRKPLTKHMLVEDVLYPQCYKFMCHFDIPDRLDVRISKKYEESLDQLADAIMQWYNPEYNELLLIAHREPNAVGSFVVDWTWKKPSHGAVDDLL